MGEESTQLDLSAELDRLDAMTGDADEETDDGARLTIGETTIDPDGVTDHTITGVAVESADPDLRGTRWKQPLHDCHRDGVTCEVGGESATLDSLVDYLGGPALEIGYVLDWATFVVAAIDGRDGATIRLRPVHVPAASDSPTAASDSPTAVSKTDGDDARFTRSIETLETASRPGFSDGDRYDVYDPVGRPLDPRKID